MDDELCEHCDLPLKYHGAEETIHCQDIQLKDLRGKLRGLYSLWFSAGIPLDVPGSKLINEIRDSILCGCRPTCGVVCRKEVR